MKWRLPCALAVLTVTASAFEPEIGFGSGGGDATCKLIHCELVSVGRGWSGKDEPGISRSDWLTFRCLKVTGVQDRIHFGVALLDLRGSVPGDPFPFDDGAQMLLPIYAGFTLWSRPRALPGLGVSMDRPRGCYGALPDLYLEVACSPWWGSSGSGRFPARASLCLDATYLIGLRAESGYLLEENALFACLQLSVGIFDVMTSGE